MFFSPTTNGTMTIPLGVTTAIISNAASNVSNVTLCLPTPTISYQNLRIIGVGLATCNFGNYIGPTLNNQSGTTSSGSPNYQSPAFLIGSMFVGGGNYFDVFWAQNQWSILGQIS
jgi:hypothetical protein